MYYYRFYEFNNVFKFYKVIAATHYFLTTSQTFVDKYILECLWSKYKAEVGDRITISGEDLKKIYVPFIGNNCYILKGKDNLVYFLNDKIYEGKIGEYWQGNNGETLMITGICRNDCDSEWSYFKCNSNKETNPIFIAFEIFFTEFEKFDDLIPICHKCKKECPYAEYSLEFKCWSCRNGY